MHLSRGDTIRHITYFFISVSQDYREYICTICQEGSKISSLLHQTFSVLTIQHAPLVDKNEKWTKHTKHRTHSWEFAVGPVVRIPHAYCWGSRLQKKKKKESSLKRAWAEAMLNPNHCFYLWGIIKQNERTAISIDRDRVGGRRVGWTG